MPKPSLMLRVQPVFLALTAFWVCCCGRRAKMREVAHVYDASPCEGVSTQAFSNVSLGYRGKDDFRLSVVINFNGSYDKLQGFFESKTCPSRKEEDCEGFLAFPLKDYCSAVVNEGDWHLVLDEFQPTLAKCPLQGFYKMKDFSVSSVIPHIKKFLGIGFLTDGKIFHTKMTLVTPSNEILLCYNMIGTFRLVKV